MMGDNEIVARESRIDLAATPDFDLGGLQVRPALRQLVKDGVPNEVEPRVMKVLVALANARPQVVSRDRLIDLCWDGRIVSDDALNRCILALRKLVQQVAPDAFEIVTVPRVGYFLEDHGVGGASPFRAARTRPLALVATIATLCLLALLAWQASRDDGRVAIAVLPFKSLAPENPYLADGLSEEILTRLSREPDFEVAGRTTSSRFRDGTDLDEIARRLDVDYVLEGSVRSDARSVRVDAALVRVEDGVRLWARRFEGSNEETFAIQDQIGTQVVAALGRSLGTTHTARAAVRTRRPANGEAYQLYLTARGLIRTRDRDYSDTTIALLKEALRLDPGFAPAWARLAEATQLAATPGGRSAILAAQPAAEAYARRALSLDPDLVEGHVALGVLLGFGSSEAQRHLRRAVALDPNNAETQLWMGIAHKAAGEYDEEVAAYRRAFALDPDWFRTRRDLAVALADRGKVDEARKLAGDQDALQARIDWSLGDFSSAVDRWRRAIASKNAAAIPVGQRGIDTAYYLVGLAKAPPKPGISPPAADIGRGVSIAWLPEVPSAAEWTARNRDAAQARLLHSDNLLAAKMMLRDGRAAELVATYDSNAGLLGIRRGVALRADQLWDAPVVALALREQGREREANALLVEADRLVERIDRGGTAPFSVDASAAGVWAAQGRTDRALDALDRAWMRGWRTPYLTGPRDVGEDAVFASLRGTPRFERLRGRLAGHWRREAREIESLPA